MYYLLPLFIIPYDQRWWPYTRPNERLSTLSEPTVTIQSYDEMDGYQNFDTSPFENFGIETFQNFWIIFPKQIKRFTFILQNQINVHIRSLHLSFHCLIQWLGLNQEMRWMATIYFETLAIMLTLSFHYILINGWEWTQSILQIRWPMSTSGLQHSKL
jgi:hypothetical protein